MADDPGVRISGLAASISAALIVGSIAAGATAVIRTETLAVRVEQLERNEPEAMQLGRQLGDLAGQVRALQKTVDDQLSELREDVRSLRRPQQQQQPR